MTEYALFADWDLSAVVALTTTRKGGFSAPPYASFNLATHVGDDIVSVERNRHLLCQKLAVPSELIWLEQVHGKSVLNLTANKKNIGQNPVADAIYTRDRLQPCAVMTADCLPLLLASSDGSEVAAVHCGWRSLHQGIIANTLSCFINSSYNVQAWLGPAIGPAVFEVGPEVKEQFVATNSDLARAFIKRSRSEKYLCDIYQIAKIQLSVLGVVNITGGDRCTLTEEEQFFSYRRDGQTGRMASLIWIK